MVETINSVEYEQTGIESPNTIGELIAALEHQNGPERVELLLMVDSRDEASAGREAGSLDEHPDQSDPAGSRCSIRQIPVEHATYFEMKNRGAQIATTQYVAFLDDDCLPGADWLTTSLAALDSGADAVIGRTRYRGPGVWARIMDCLDWGDVRATASGSAACLLPNNSAFRREAFLRYPWDTRHRRSGGCMAPYLRMMADGMQVVYAPEMSAAHGNNYRELWGFAHRLRNGHDTAMILRNDDQGIVPHRWLLRLGPAGGIVLALGRIWGDLKRLTRHFGDFGISRPAVPLVWLVMAPMRLIEGAAYALSCVRPDVIGQRWG
ncbi:MAG TPA: glycosyltransferase family A protein [Acidimicrobiales bacterium]|nr:glycosyltransferase family A protein [Acidimicrobiales bacterium]